MSKTASQDFVPIKEIRQNVLILKTGEMRQVLLASSINFALKSYDEQRAILSQFQSFLNTLDFSLQFYTQSRRLDIRPYLQILQEREGLQDNDLMKIQLREYIEFVRTFVNEVDIMSKNFFVVIPYTPSNIDLGENITSFFTKKKNDKTDEERFAEHRTQIEQRRSLVEQGLNRIGVRTITLGENELVELYYHLFNPTDASASAPKK